MSCQTRSQTINTQLHCIIHCPIKLHKRQMPWLYFVSNVLISSTVEQSQQQYHIRWLKLTLTTATLILCLWKFILYGIALCVINKSTKMKTVYPLDSKQHSIVTLTHPPTSSSLQITDSSSFLSICFTSSLQSTTYLCQPNSSLSISDSPVPTPVISFTTHATHSFTLSVTSASLTNLSHCRLSSSLSTDPVDYYLAHFF